MNNKYLQSNNFVVGGIHRAILIDVNDELRVYIPGIHNYRDDFYLEGSLYNINEEVVLNEFKTFPKVQWNVPNEEAKQHEKPFHPCWVTFENNDIQRPVIMGWCGNGIMYSAGSSGTNYTISENSADDNNLTYTDTQDNISGEFKLLGIDFIITHYCCEEYPHICNAGPPYITATGTKPHVGGCAVDPKVIPLGSIIMINNKTYICEDTGGAIKGHRVDIVVKTHNEALKLGKLKDVSVYIKTN